MGNTGAYGPPFPFAGLANRAPVLRSILVTEPMTDGGVGRYDSEPVAVKVFPPNVVEHEMAYGAFLGWRAPKEKGRVFLIDPTATVPDVSCLPSTETTTFKLPLVLAMGDALATWVKVMGASTRMETDASVVDASSGR
jgi:hypothetical protein